MQSLRSHSLLSKDQAIRWEAEILLGSGQNEKVIQLVEAVHDRGNRLKACLAVAYARQGRPDDALELARRISAHDREAEWAMGQVCEVVGNYEEALVWYERVTQRWFVLGKGVALRGIADSLVALADHREACAACEWAIRSAPFVRVDLVCRLEECLRRLGKDREADTLYPWTQDPDDVMAE